MAFNYENWLLENLYLAESNCGLEGYKFVVENEQLYAKRRTLEPETIYVVVKYLSSSISYGEKTQPIQVIILSEQNAISNTKAIFDSFANTHNFKCYSYLDNSVSTFIKHQYNECVVLSNFNEISYGNRTLLYISGTLSIMENIYDVSDFKINGQNVDLLNFQLSYSMSGNTQNTRNSELATTVKSVSTLSIAIVLPLSENFNFISNVLGVINGTQSGNRDFIMYFRLGNEEFSKSMKLSSATISTSPSSVPVVNLGFML